MSNVMNWVKRQQRRLAVTCTILWSLSATTGVLAQRGAATTRPLVEIRTTFGTMVVALYNETPQHRDNFLELVRNGAYDSLLFHRVVPSLMIQGGDPDSRRAGLDATLGTGDPGYSLPAEIVPGLFHKKGALAAAPLSEQAGTEGRTHGSQFYIVHGKTFQPQELDLLAKRNARLGTPVNDQLSFVRTVMFSAAFAGPHSNRATNATMREYPEERKRLSMDDFPTLVRPTRATRMGRVRSSVS